MKKQLHGKGKKLRKVGLHFRLTTTLSDLMEKAIRLKSPIFQCFFIKQGGSHHVEFSEEEIEKCNKLSHHFDALYLHASYWVNLAGRRNNGWRAFQHELGLAEKLGFSHMIIHPGSATGCETKDEGIVYLAKALNKVLSKDSKVTIVLENGAHARKTVGGNLNDFAQLLKLLDHPEKIKFCIDTAHAHSYGYDVIGEEAQNIFLEQVDALIGRKNIALLHLNETAKECGSYIDQHANFGEGKIGNEALKRFMNHPVCKNIPIILEPPAYETEEEEVALLKLVTRWNKAGKKL